MILRVIFYGSCALVVLGLLYWLSRRAKNETSAEDLLRNTTSADLLPTHYRFFPQVCRALSIEDRAYLIQRAGPRVRRSAGRIRRQVGLEFLRGLREDYKRLDRLARTLTALAPEANARRETERLWFALRFAIQWYFIWASLWSGMTPVLQLQWLTNLIGTITARMESALGAWQDSSISARPANLNA